MPTPEEILRQREAGRQAASRQREREDQVRLEHLWSELQQEAKSALRRLEAKGWPGGVLLGQTKRSWWSGKEVTVNQTAAWEIFKEPYMDAPGYQHSQVFVLSNGKIDIFPRSRNLRDTMTSARLCEAIENLKKLGR